MPHAHKVRASLAKVTPRKVGRAHDYSIYSLFAGGLSLFGGALAVYAVKGSPLHLIAGRIFFAATIAIFLTAIPLAIVNENIYLFLIAIFSFYLAFAGWRFARNVSGRPAAIDLLAVLLMLSSGLGMWALAWIFYQTENSHYVVMVLFWGDCFGARHH